MATDSSLWEALRAGDKTALSVIYEQEVDALYRYGCRFTASRSLVEDCIQDLFIELWKNRSSIGGTTAIRQYLLVALRRKIIRQRQQQSNRQERHLKVISTQETAAQSSDVDIIQQEEQTQQEQKIKNALQQLSGRQREILHLKYFEELDYKAIAQLLNINYQSVRNTASAGIKALRNILTYWLLFFFIG